MLIEQPSYLTNNMQIIMLIKIMFLTKFLNKWQSFRKPVLLLITRKLVEVGGSDSCCC